MSKAELLDEYGDIISSNAYPDPYSPNSQSKMRTAKWVMERYKQVEHEEVEFSPKLLKKVDKKFKAKVDKMSQEELEKEFPYLQHLQSPVHPAIYFSKTDLANTSYLEYRYFKLDSQKEFRWRDPNFMNKIYAHVNKTGIDPITGKEADDNLKFYAKHHGTIEGLSNALAFGTGLYSAYQASKPVTVTKDVVHIPETYSPEVLGQVEHTESFRENTVKHIFEGEVKRRQAKGYHYANIEGTAGEAIPDTRVDLGNGVYEVDVKVNGVIKHAKSTMFPDTMSPQEVVDAINEAYNGREKVPNTRNQYRGEANNGIKVIMYLDKDEKIISAFPAKSQ
ncbi:EndoU domain-containing protein [Streptococcus oricebi]|nr:EndoU domain-containing protein [Streptococcus oricebi]